MASIDFKEQQEISIRIGGISSPVAGVAVQMVHGRIAAITEKAIKVEDSGRSAWFPKSALINIAGEPNLFKTAHWFKVSDAAFRMSNYGVLSFRY